MGLTGLSFNTHARAHTHTEGERGNARHKALASEDKSDASEALKMKEKKLKKGHRGGNSDKEQGQDKLDDKCQKLESNPQHLEYMDCLRLLPHRASQCV